MSCLSWSLVQNRDSSALTYYSSCGSGRICLRIEVKWTDNPRITPSIRKALSDLNLERVLVVYPGDEHYALAERVEAVPLRTLLMEGLSASVG